MNKYNLKVGQTLFIRSEYDRKEGLHEYKIEKIGRVWAKLKHTYYRVNIETLQLDGGRGTVWLSVQQYIDAQEVGEAWRKFTRDVYEVSHRRPDHITLEAIKEARLKLGI